MAVYAVIGYPLGHTMSPQVMVVLFKGAGVDATYTAFPVKPERLAEGVRSLLAMKIAGFNVTRPHKETIIPHLTGLSEEAKAVGAVNCVKVEYPELGGATPLTKFAHAGLDLKKAPVKLIGYNTDVYGFSRLLDFATRHSPLATRALVLGTGGSAKAVAHALSQRGIPFTFISRTPARNPGGESAPPSLRGGRDEVHPVGDAPLAPISSGSGGATYEEVGELLSSAHLLINCTPVGQFPDVNEMPPVPLDAIGKDHVVIDLIYNPGKTRLLAECEKRGAAVFNGWLMLVHQAARSLELWLGRPLPGDRIEALAGGSGAFSTWPRT